MPILVYSAWRLLLFLASLGLLSLLGLQGWPARVVGAVLIAFGLSYVLLPGPRDKAARYLAAKDAARKAGKSHVDAARADAEAEDAAVDAAAAREAGTPVTPPGDGATAR